VPVAVLKEGVGASMTLEGRGGFVLACMGLIAAAALPAALRQPRGFHARNS